MFGLRPDGKKVKHQDPIEKIMPHIMWKRNDAHNWCEVKARCEPLDAYIKKVSEEKGISLNYMHIIVACLVRLYAQRQKLNRLVMNGRIFQRYSLYSSITIKSSLKDEAPDLSLKTRFTGRENIFEVKEKLDHDINKMLKSQANNKTTKLAGVLTCVPNFLIKFLVGMVKWLDKHGMLPNAILNASPFHTSFYMTNLKSIKGEWIFHHLYNFGTTGCFISIGKEKMEPVVENNQVVPGKVVRMGVTMDERYCDGFYFVKTLRLWRDLMENPQKLEEILDIEPIESPKERRKRLKAIKKEQKRKK